MYFSLYLLIQNELRINIIIQVKIVFSRIMSVIYNLNIPFNHKIALSMKFFVFLTHS